MRRYVLSRHLFHPKLTSCGNGLLESIPHNRHKAPAVPASSARNHLLYPQQRPYLVFAARTHVRISLHHNPNRVIAHAQLRQLALHGRARRHPRMVPLGRAKQTCAVLRCLKVCANHCQHTAAHTPGRWFEFRDLRCRCIRKIYVARHQLVTVQHQRHSNRPCCPCWRNALCNRRGHDFRWLPTVNPLEHALCRRVSRQIHRPKLHRRATLHRPR